MLASEVTPVLKALRNNGLNVVAIHNHMTEGEPSRLLFALLGTGPTEKLPEGSEPRSINSTKAKALTAPMRTPRKHIVLEFGKPDRCRDWRTPLNRVRSALSDSALRLYR